MVGSKKDYLYDTQRERTPFSFNEEVASIFDDMIVRSVPGYHIILKSLTKFAARFYQPNTIAYDLGCSLGSVSLAMAQGIKPQDRKQSRIVGIDLAMPMVTRAKQRVQGYGLEDIITIRQGDILTYPIEQASMVVLNFTLQFLEIEQRTALIEHIYKGLVPGGVLILSEKIRVADAFVDEVLIDIYHDFKRDNGYSDLAISQKRQDLERVLIPQTEACHKERLEACGFSTMTCWFRYYNFASFLAVKK